VSDPLASDERLAEVLDDVGLRELRSRQGLDLPVGEGGSALSGGERQRLAIARALLSGADIVLLDEATANLDGLSEDLIRGVIDRVFAGKTIVSVAHRLSTIIDYDTIYLLEHGRIVASGTHADLFASSPLYRALATEQRLTATAVNSTKSKSR
jgi:ATP-binding cassette subfamily B protein/ATP-binding cassette subfamily C protein